MALATTCPHCKTSFRVVPDQLKLRRGLVRCGVCRHVFPGIDSLRYVEDPARRPAPPRPEPPAAVIPSSIQHAAPVEPEPVEPEPVEPEPVEPEPVEPEPVEPGPVEPGPVEPGPVETGPVETGPALRREYPAASIPGPAVLPYASEPPPPVPPERAAPSPARATRPQAEPAAVDDDEADAVDFFAPDRRAGGFSSRSAAFASVTAFALAGLLLLQLAIGSRDWLASRVPALAPALTAALAPLGLRVAPPQEPAALTIESFELQPAGEASLYALNALLRNRSGHVVQWPALELTLLDGAGEVVVRRVLRPSEYLDAPEQSLREGIAGRAERAVRAALEVSEAAPTGYRVRIVAP